MCAGEDMPAPGISFGAAGAAADDADGADADDDDVEEDAEEEEEAGDGLVGTRGASAGRRFIFHFLRAPPPCCVVCCRPEPTISIINK
jgi:hypothetical protein